jgi:HK97 family phage major capsid protein
MNKKIKELREKIQKSAERLDKISKNENFDTDADLHSEFDQLEQEIKDDQKHLERLMIAQNLSAEEGKEGLDANEEKEINKNFSLLEFVNQVISGKVEGFNAEMQEEGMKEFKDAGVSAALKSKEFIIPRKVLLASPDAGFGRTLLGGQRMDVTAGSAAGGGNAIDDEPLGYIQTLRQSLQLTQMGARFLTGLVGNLPYTKENGVASFAWEGEQDDAAETTSTYTLKELSPKRAAAWMDVSDQWRIQTSPDVEAMLNFQLIQAIREGVEVAAYNGSSPAPTGILNTSGIGDVAGGANGSVPTYDDILELESDLAVANAIGMPHTITTPQIRKILKGTLKFSGVSGTIWDKNEMNGYQAHISNFVPSDLTKGSSSGILHAIIHGLWEYLWIGQWGGITLKVDDLTQAIRGTTRLVTNSYMDVLVAHEGAFAAKQDCLLS